MPSAVPTSCVRRTMRGPKRRPFMAEDSSSPDKIEQLNARLDYLESVARDTVARLYAIEKQLGLVFRAVPRELNLQAKTEPETPGSRLRAVEEAPQDASPVKSAAGLELPS